MAHPTSVITDAFHRFQRTISEEDAHEFASTELKDVQAAILEIQNMQRKRKSVQNLRRVEPLLRGIEKYSKVVEVLCNGTPYLSYVWAPIKMMLQLASNHRDVFEALLNAYEDIAGALPRFDRYEKAFKDNPEFQNVLASVYCGIVDFHQRAYKFFRRRAWHILFCSLWTDFGSRFDVIIGGLKKQRDFVEKERQKHDTEVFDKLERDRNVAQLQHAITWLSMDDKVQQESEYERISHRRHDKTCEWILKESTMKAWMKDDEKQQLLWICGKPGAGKSVMCSYLVRVLLETSEVSTCYFFCNNHDSGNIPHTILRTIALQLLRRNLDLASLVSNGYVYRGIGCDMAQLRILVPQFLEIMPKTRIVIDGLDECSHENQKSILKELQTICLGPEKRCKLLFASRKEVIISQRLALIPQIILDGRKEVDLDIQSFIKYKITKLRTTDKELLKNIESVLVKEANGMFLWVRLVIEELRYCYNDAALEERATTLPKGLGEAYNRILERIMSGTTSYYASSVAIKILEWMACASRALKIYEVLDGIALFPGCTILDRRTKMNKDVLDLCRPLIEDGPTNTVEFVHFSAKEYILKEGCRDRKPFIEIESANLNIAFSCIAYLNSSQILLHESHEHRAAVVVQGFHGLQLYANQFWLRHLLIYFGLRARSSAHIPQAFLDQLGVLLSFQKDSNTQYSESEPSLTPSITEEMMMALAEFPQIKMLVSKVVGFRNSLDGDDLLNKSPEDVSKRSCVTDPTHFSAARHNYLSTLESLLDPNANQIFPKIDSDTLLAFQEIFGPSAFVCRYLCCSRATDGFDTQKQREAHEATHERKFRCSHPKCVCYLTGFTSRAALNKHNGRYHAIIRDDESLVSVFTAQQKQKNAKENIPYPDLIAQLEVDRTLNSNGRPKRKDNPSSGEIPSALVENNKRSLRAFNGQRSSWEDDTVPNTDYQARMKLANQTAYSTDLDDQTMRKEETFYNSAEAEKDPWGIDDLTGTDLKKLMNVEKLPEIARSEAAHQSSIQFQQDAGDKALVPSLTMSVPSVPENPVAAKALPRWYPFGPATICVITEESFKSHCGAGLASSESLNASLTKSMNLNSVLADIDQLRKLVCIDVGCDESLIRFWSMSRRINLTVRPYKPTSHDIVASELFEIKSSQPLCMFAEVAERLNYIGKPVWPVLFGEQYNSILIFLKLFDTQSQSLKGVGHIYAGIYQSVADLQALILRKMGWNKRLVSGDITNLLLLEEVEPGFFEILKPSETVYQAELGNGDILCFQWTSATRPSYEEQAMMTKAILEEKYSGLN